MPPSSIVKKKQKVNEKDGSKERQKEQEKAKRKEKRGGKEAGQQGKEMNVLVRQPLSSIVQDSQPLSAFRSTWSVVMDRSSVLMLSSFRILAKTEH